MARGYLADSGDGVRITLRVSPGAKKSEIKGLYGERAIKLSVASAPEKGRANTEVERLLAEIVGVAPSEVEVVRGASGRDKVALVRGVPRERVGGSLQGLLGGDGERDG